jgi:hypothetical protein
MSGLLRRLAAHAIGAAPTVRPVVGWTPPAAQPSFVEGFPSVEAGESRHETSPLPAAEKPEASRAAARVGATEPPGFLEVTTLRSRAESSIVEGGSAVEGDSYPDLSPGESRPGAAPVVGARAAERPATQDATAARAQIDDGEPVGPPPVGRRSAPRTSAPAEIPTLLPPRPPAQVFPQRAPAPTPTPPSIASPAIEEVTEVHVSIGRIELTAVHEAPPKRREPACARKPRSLEDYLAARQERPR